MADSLFKSLFGHDLMSGQLGELQGLQNASLSRQEMEDHLVRMRASTRAMEQAEPTIRLKDAVPCMELAGMIALMPEHLRHEVCAAFFMAFGAAGKRIDIAAFWSACKIPEDQGQG